MKRKRDVVVPECLSVTTKRQHRQEDDPRLVICFALQKNASFPTKELSYFEFMERSKEVHLCLFSVVHAHELVCKELSSLVAAGIKVNAWKVVALLLDSTEYPTVELDGVDARYVDQILHYFGASPKIFASWYDLIETAGTSATCPPCFFASAYLLNLPVAFLMSETKARVQQFQQLEWTTREDAIAFAKFQGFPNELFSSLVTRDEITERLQMKPELFQRLQDCAGLVMAGGACSRLGNAQENKLPSSDIDIFVLDCGNQNSIARQEFASVVKYLRTEGWKPYRFKGDSIMTFMLPGNVETRLQFIGVPMTDCRELIESFDLPYVRSYCLKGRLYRSYRTDNDWLTNHCSNGDVVEIKPKRLVKAFLKGYHLTPAAQKHLAITVGWPLPPKIIHRGLYDFPILPIGICFNTYNFLLARSGYIPVEDDVSDCMLQPLKTSCSYTGFLSNLEPGEYVKTLSLGMAPERRPFRRSLSSARIRRRTRYIDAAYTISLPTCVIPFVEASPGSLKILQIRSSHDAQKFIPMLDAICQKFGVKTARCTHPIRDDTREVHDIDVRVTSHTRWFKEGLELATPPRLHSKMKLKASGRPFKLLQTTENLMDQARVIFRLDTMFLL